MNLAQFKGYEKEIEQISNYINGDDYPDEIPYRIMGLFMREHKTLLAEVKRLREWKEAFEHYMGKDEARRYVFEYSKYKYKYSKGEEE